MSKKQSIFKETSSIYLHISKAVYENIMGYNDIILRRHGGPPGILVM